MTKKNDQGGEGNDAPNPDIAKEIEDEESGKIDTNKIDNINDGPADESTKKPAKAADDEDEADESETDDDDEEDDQGEDDDTEKDDETTDKGDDEDDADEDDADDDDDSDDEDDSQSKGRKPRYVDIRVHKTAKKALKTLERENKELLLKLTANAKDGDLSAQDEDKFYDELAEEAGMNKTALKKLGDHIKQGFESKFSQLQASQRADNERATKLEEQRLYQEDYRRVAKELPALKSEAVRKAITKLAYTKEHRTTPLRTLAIAFLHDNPQPAGKGRTAEANEGRSSGSRNAKLKHASEITEDDLDDIDDKNLTKLSKELEESESGLRFQ